MNIQDTMTKAEQRALEKYPKRKDGRKKYYNCTDDEVRYVYAQGYRKAEKDLALTWEDIKVINILGSVVIEEHHGGWTAEDVWKEVLRRYNKSTK